MDLPLECCVCTDFYSDSNPPMVSVTCGHTICEKCSLRCIHDHRRLCPICRAKLRDYVKNHAVMALVSRYGEGKQQNQPQETASPHSTRNSNSPPPGRITTGHSDAHGSNRLPGSNRRHEIPSGRSRGPQAPTRPFAASAANANRGGGNGRLSEDALPEILGEDVVETVLEQWLDENPSSSVFTSSDFLEIHSQELPSELLEIAFSVPDENELLLLPESESSESESSESEPSDSESSDSEPSESTVQGSTTEDDEESEASDDVPSEEDVDGDATEVAWLVEESCFDGLDIDLVEPLDCEFE